MTTTDDSRPTKDRLIDAAIGLFAHNGVAATTVGDIERAAGMAPRSGALYKYFESKGSLLEAGLERHLAAISDVGDDLALRPLGDLRSELTMLARWTMAELDRERTILHVIEREGVSLGELRNRMRTGVSDRGYQVGASILARWLPDLTVVERESLAVVTIGSLVNYKRSTWTFGAAPLGLTEDEFISAWVDLLYAQAGEQPCVLPGAR